MNCRKDPFVGFFSYSYEIANVALTVALSSAIEIGVADKRISNIVGGTLLMSSGISLLAKADVPQMVKSYFSIESNTHETLFNTIRRFGIATLGLGIVGVGAYNLSQGIFDLVSPMINLKTCEQKLSEAKKNFFICPEAKNLWIEVEKLGKFTLECNSKMMSPGGVIPETRKIFVSNYVTPGSLASTIESTIGFELINLKNSKTVLNLSQKICTFQSSDFARALELYELESAKSYNILVSKCNQYGFWPLSEIYEIDEAKYLNQQMRSGHTSTFLLTWMVNCNPENVEHFLVLLVKAWKEQGLNLPVNFRQIYDVCAQNPTEFFKEYLLNLNF